MHTDFYNGKVLLINKPYRLTSFAAVKKVKWLIKNQPDKFGVNSQPDNINPETKSTTPKLKVGHAGTLDPLATGLLIICTGKGTKNIEKYQAQEKEYTGTFFIGATTPCFDLEQPIDKNFPTDHITNDMIYALAKKYIGVQEQTPPLFSAIKIEGKRAYDIARSGNTAVIKPKQIEIKQFEITRIALPEIDFKVICSKGTYVRSLARDFGLALNSGAHLTALCRTRIGNYLLADAISL